MNTKIIFILPLLLALGLTGASCSSGEGPGPVKSAKESSFGIVLFDNSAVRLDPIIYSARIALLPKGQKVEIVDVSKAKSWIGKSADYWYRIKLDNGVAGWIFGENIRTFKSNQGGSAQHYIAELRQEEEKFLKKSLTGKWWSVNTRGDFTNHSLELSEDGKYKSALRGGSALEGEYNFDFNQKQIVFLGKTTFGQALNFIRRGQMFILEVQKEKLELRFNKISDDIEQNAAIEKQEEEKIPGDTGRKTDAPDQ